MSDVTPAVPVVPPYDWRISAWKGLKHALGALGAVAFYGAGDALAQYLSNPAAVTGFLGPIAKTQPWVFLFVPMIVGASSAFLNWRKNRD